MCSDEFKGQRLLNLLTDVKSREEGPRVRTFFKIRGLVEFLEGS